MKHTRFSIFTRELVKHNVQSSRVGRLPNKSSNHLYLTSSLWLSNNSLTSIQQLEDLAKTFLESPNDLRWLDLAYNRIRDLDDELFKFKKLTILYLHGNDISDMRTVSKLRVLSNLKTLTLHGNPIEQTKSYRRYVIAILPQISNLDFSPVIEAERKRALPTGFHKIMHADS